MILAPGTRFGPYEILGELGAGGMGVVYRARDGRLGREVALKVLPIELHDDVERRRRFEDEARAAGGLSHPNLLAVFDVGEHDGAPYLVTELLDGTTLREALRRGPLGVRRALDVASQITAGLAAAHQRGVVHRDLKPENVFVTRDDHVKILDFGLAKVAPSTVVDTNGPTTPGVTLPGTVLGTPGYMAPEQVRGEPADARSDLFALGVILYETLAGRRAFEGETLVDVGHATLRADPPELPPSVPPGVAQLVARCLDKRPERRFQSAQDLGFAVESLRASVSVPSLTTAVTAPERPRFWRWIAPAVALAIIAFTVAATRDRQPASTGGKPAAHPAEARPIDYRRLTFRFGFAALARFVPGSEDVIYSASFDGAPSEIYVVRPGHAEPRLFLGGGDGLFAVSSAGDVAIALGEQQHVSAPRSGSVLAVTSLAGGAPRSVAEHVINADWTPDGKELVLLVVDPATGATRLQTAAGRVITEGRGLVNVRVSPDGRRVALSEHTLPSDSRGSIRILELADGREVARFGPFRSVQGLAWRRADVLWAIVHDGTSYQLTALQPGAAPRMLTGFPKVCFLRDVASDGRILISMQDERHRIAGGAPGGKRELDLSWLDGSDAMALSDDGATLLFYEAMSGAAPDWLTYKRDVHGGPAVQIAVGLPLALSRDRSYALVSPPPFHTLSRVPLGVGPTVPLQSGEIARPSHGFWFRDGNSIALVANAAGKRPRIWRIDAEGKAPPRALSDEGVVSFAPPSPDDRWLAVVGADGQPALLPVAGGPAVPIAGLHPHDFPIQWTPDGKRLYVRRLPAGDELVERADGYLSTRGPVTVVLHDLASGKETPWQTIVPADSSVEHIDNLLITPDGGAYAYGYFQLSSELYLVSGLD